MLLQVYSLVNEGMSYENLKPQFIKYLAANPGWHASAAIQRIEWRDHRGKLASASNVARRLRELADDGRLLVEYRKNHAYYSIAEAARPTRQIVEHLPDGSVRVSYRRVGTDEAVAR